MSSLFDSPMSLPRGTPNALAPSKSLLGLVEPSITVPVAPANPAVQLDTPDTGDQGKARFTFSSPILGNAKRTGELPAANQVFAQQSFPESSTLESMRDEAGKKLLALLGTSRGSESTICTGGGKVSRSRGAMRPSSTPGTWTRVCASKDQKNHSTIGQNGATPLEKFSSVMSVMSRSGKGDITDIGSCDQESLPTCTVELSPIFGVQTGEIEYLEDQLALGRRFVGDSGANEHSSMGRLHGGGSPREDSKSGCAKHVCHKLDMDDDVFEEPGLFNNGSMPQTGFGASINAGSPYTLLNLPHVSDDVNKVAVFAKQMGGHTEEAEQATVSGLQDAIEDSEVSSAVESRAKKAHPAMRLAEAIDIEDRKRAARIARKMEPDFIYDSQRLAMEEFEAMGESLEFGGIEGDDLDGFGFGDLIEEDVDWQE